MGRCKDCKFWGYRFDGVCDREGDWHNERAPDNGFYVEATALDDSDLQAQLVTGPNFGCVQWERNDK